MAMPKETSIELPLLRVVADAGGSLNLHDAIRQVEPFFPDLTDVIPTSNPKRRPRPSTLPLQPGPRYLRPGPYHGTAGSVDRPWRHLDAVAGGRSAPAPRTATPVRQ